MILISINRSIKFAAQSFWRNFWLSMATIFIIFLSILSINFLVSIKAVTSAAVVAVKDKIDVSVRFKENIKESRIIEIKTYLQSLPQVKSVTYKSPEENLNSFKSWSNNDPSILESLKAIDRNPMYASLIIKAKDLGDYPGILNIVESPTYSDLIASRSFDDNSDFINRINVVSNFINKFGLIVCIIFIIISLLIVYNTVRIAIFTHQNEIAIMKLVGAGNWFVRAPFIIETVFSGLVAFFLAMAVTYPLLSFAEKRLSVYFGGSPVNLVSYFNENFFMIFGLQFIGVIILGFISAIVALNKYMKV